MSGFFIASQLYFLHARSYIAFGSYIGFASYICLRQVILLTPLAVVVRSNMHLCKYIIIQLLTLRVSRAILNKNQDFYGGYL